MPQLEWVHVFIHTFNVIAENLYLQTELQHGTTNWDDMKEILLLTFSFEYGFEFIDEALQVIKEAIFWTPVEPLTWVHPDWSTQLQHDLECYNVTVEEADEDLQNINIHESEGQHEAYGPTVDILGIS